MLPMSLCLADVERVTAVNLNQRAEANGDMPPVEVEAAFHHQRPLAEAG